MSHKTMFNRFIIGMTSAFLLSYSIKKGINLSYDILRDKLFTPKLIRETSRYDIKRYLSLSTFLRMNRPVNQMFNGLFFTDELHKQLNTLSQSMLNRKKSKVPYRNFLFYGPPGTGKTTFAKNLALKSGIDYAILTGADISPLKSKAVIELNKVFNWANRSRKGVLLFIDEADAFLRKRTEGIHLSEDLRNAINTFLYRTGSQSNKFMFVLATNEPRLIDHAVQNRIDEIMVFGNGTIKEIERILRYQGKLYFKTDEELAVLNNHIPFMAKELNGFSGREVVKFIVLLYNEMIANNNKELTIDFINAVIAKIKKQRSIKASWNRLSLIDNFNNTKVKH